MLGACTAFDMLIYLDACEKELVHIHWRIGWEAPHSAFRNQDSLSRRRPGVMSRVQQRTIASLAVFVAVLAIINIFGEAHHMVSCTHVVPSSAVKRSGDATIPLDGETHSKPSFGCTKLALAPKNLQNFYHETGAALV